IPGAFPQTPQFPPTPGQGQQQYGWGQQQPQYGQQTPQQHPQQQWVSQAQKLYWGSQNQSAPYQQRTQQHQQIIQQQSQGQYSQGQYTQGQQQQQQQQPYYGPYFGNAQGGPTEDPTQPSGSGASFMLIHRQSACVSGAQLGASIKLPLHFSFFLRPNTSPEMPPPPPPPPPPQPPTSTLIHTTHAFLSAFAAGAPPSETLEKYFAPAASIHEHGPEWARQRLPFLARTFSGRSPAASSPSANTKHSSSSPNVAAPNEEGSTEEALTMDTYYDLLSSTLRYHPRDDGSSVPPLSEFSVDEGKGVVTVVFRAGFESVATGKGWLEEVVYVVGFEGEGKGEGPGEDGRGEHGKGRERRIQKLDLWADVLSAWVAVGGEAE
ncbi:MAG: hypothetical protein Q9184_004870, partial [Pyrenodesmia sp. 2 TL-2023]